MNQRIALAVTVITVLAGCATPPTPRESGTVGGAAIGAATGAVLGGIAGASGKGAAIGAAVGAVTGALTGDAVQSEQADRAYQGRYAHAASPGRIRSRVEPCRSRSCRRIPRFSLMGCGSDRLRSSAVQPWCRLPRVSILWSFVGQDSV